MQISEDQFKNFLVNTEILPNHNNTLRTFELINVTDDNDNLIYAIRTNWLDNSDQDLAYSINVMVYPTTINNNIIYVLGSGPRTTTTHTCTCHGCAHTIGCDASLSSVGGFCTCSPCSGNCEKESKIVITETASLYM